MSARNLNSSDAYRRRREAIIRRCYGRVQSILEDSYKLKPTIAEKLLDTFFSPDFLPSWYFHSNSSEEISNHVYTITQLLNARTEHLRQVSDDGRAITYFMNIGRDYPGKLLALLNENINMGLVAFDAVKTRSGIWIVTMERDSRPALRLTKEEQLEIDELLRVTTGHATANGYAHSGAFLRGLPPNYLNEEINSPMHPLRILRHLGVYEEAYEGDYLAVRVESTNEEIDDENEKLTASELRCSVGVRNPPKSFPASILTLFKDSGISLTRAYYDTFGHYTDGPAIGILSIYVGGDENLDEIKSRLVDTRMPQSTREAGDTEEIGNTLERIVRLISDPDAVTEERIRALGELRRLAAENNDVSSADEYGNFLLNTISDFFEGAKHNGLIDNDGILLRLLSFDAFDEFWVETLNAGAKKNSEGYRVKHSSVRGPGKGGIRNDMIVRFDEVAALSFMMSWKCARSKILFGGAKGGLKINPNDYRGATIDFFDTLTNFGRSLFLVTGPACDVPAGDVGCGAVEIGHMFEGFKSALRDLATMAFGLNQGVAFIGDKILSVNKAREILKGHFDIDHQERDLLRELVVNEKYLELVAAAQITGKPRMGIAARTGATGRGICYSIQATVANLCLDGKWDAATTLSSDDMDLVRIVAGVDERTVLAAHGKGVISANQWEALESRVLPAMLTGKTVVVQGFGKVGTSLLQELTRFGVRIVAVADIGGAVLGDDLSLADLLKATRETGSVTGLSGEGITVVPGTEGSESILELACDILVPAALENAITAANAHKVKARIEACGSNGPNTAKAERILNQRGVTVIYDFLANGGGVVASYFEWLRNLAERFRYESENIRGIPFSPDTMDPYIMPEYAERIKSILAVRESNDTTTAWNLVMRDIMYAAVNEDYRSAKDSGVSMKTAGFANAQLRVLAAILAKSDPASQASLWGTLSDAGRKAFVPFLLHPEIGLHGLIDPAILH